MLTLRLCFLCSVAAGLTFGDTVLGLPLSFEPNLGQTGKAVRFLSHSAIAGAGYAVLLTDHSAVFRFSARDKNRPPAVFEMKLAGAQRAVVSPAQDLPGKVNYFISNDPSKWIRGVPTYGKIAYQHVYPGVDLVYYGTQQQLEYDFVVAPGADPNAIELEFSGSKPRLAADGRLQFVRRGASLVLRQPVVYQTIHGKKQFITGGYKLKGRRVQFTLGAYDRGQELVIDPVLEYLTYLGGPGGATAIGASQTACAQCDPQHPAQGVAVDTSGNLYVTGYTTSLQFPLHNALQSQDKGNAHQGIVFVSEIDPKAGALVYSTYLGGSVYDRGSAIAVDSSGTAYVTGQAWSPDFPVTSGAFQTLCAPGPGPNKTLVGGCSSASNAFLTKLAPGGGSLVYSTFLGGSHSSYANAVAIDSQGRAYLAGTSNDQCDNNQPYRCFPETANALLPQALYNNSINPNAGNPGAAFVAVFDPTGTSLLYSTLYGDKDPSHNANNTSTTGTGVAVDPSGNFYLTGFGLDPRIPTTAGAFQPTGTNNQSNGGIVYRGFVAKFSPVTGSGTGASMIYGTYLGGTAANEMGSEQVSGIAVDASGNAYITGYTQSYDFPVTAGANNTNSCTATSFCQNNGFLTKLNPQGTALVWSTLVGALPVAQNGGSGTMFDIGAPRVDGSGNVYITGRGAYNYPVANPLQPANKDLHGGVFVTEYDPSASTILFSTVFYSPSGPETYSGGIGIDSEGNIYVGGSTAAADLPVTPGVLQPACAGCTSGTGFLAKINPHFVPVVAAVVNGASFAGGGVVPGEIATAFGTDLASSSGINLTSGLPLPALFLNDSLMVNSQAVPLFAVDNVNGQQQINFQVPWGLVVGSKANIAVTNSGFAGASISVPVLAAQPGIFNYNAAGQTFGAILHANFQLANTANPAKPGETVLIYCTGLGAVSSPPADGAAGSGQKTTATTTVTIGGVNAPLSFSGLAPGFVGLYQINAKVPAGLKSGNQAVVVAAAGASSNSVLLPIGQ